MTTNNDYAQHAARKRECFTSRIKFEAKQETGKPLPTLTGYALTWNTKSDDRGGYFVRLLPMSGRPIANGPTLALCNHDYQQLLASTANGTLRMTPDQTGMKVEIDPCDVSYGRDMVALIQRGDVCGMSFGMLSEGAVYTEIQESGQTIRNYSAFSFDEVSITPIPAFTSTTIDAAESESSGEDMEESESSDEDEDLTKKPKSDPESLLTAAPVPTPERNKLSVQLQEIALDLLNIK